MTEKVLAIDIGGTKMAAAVVAESGQLGPEHQTPTVPGGTAEELFSALIRLCDAALEAAEVKSGDLRGIGVGCGGPMQYPEGLVSPLNIHGWREFALRARLRAHYGRDVIVDNDAKAYALGECWIGGGQGARGFLGIVVSTGVGGGIVINGHLLHGAHGNAGHIGHVVVNDRGPDCACGAVGCVEAIASGPSMVRLYQRERPMETAITAADLATRARAQDPLAMRLFADAGMALGRGIAATASLVDLDLVIVGGGVSRSSELFWPALMDEFHRSARLDFTRNVEIRVSELRVSASLAGAAALVYLAG
jgi:glucokinase